jgi:general secretion pathway protein G
MRKCMDDSLLFNKRSGFTLIEIMIVVIIIASLAAIVMPRLSGRSEQAKTVVAQTDINSSISLALKLYQLDNGKFPTTEQGLAALISKPSSAPVPMNWKEPYLDKKPVDPWGNPYLYKSPGAHNASTFDLYSFGGDGVEGTADDVKNWE